MLLDFQSLRPGEGRIYLDPLQVTSVKELKAGNEMAAAIALDGEKFLVADPLRDCAARINEAREAIMGGARALADPSDN